MTADPKVEETTTTTTERVKTTQTTLDLPIDTGGVLVEPIQIDVCRPGNSGSTPAADKANGGPTRIGCECPAADDPALDLPGAVARENYPGCTTCVTSDGETIVVDEGSEASNTDCADDTATSTAAATRGKSG